MNTLTGWEPLSDLANDFFGRDFETRFNSTKDTHYLNVHVDVIDDDYIINAEVPGLKEENLDVSFENNSIKITADYGEDNNVFRSGKYSRVFKTTDINTDETVAELKDGILTIILPKADEKKARKIKIN